MRMDISDDGAEAVFRTRLKAVMKDRGMSQKELARAAGISEGNLSRYIRGRMDPGLHVLSLLSRALEVSPALFFCPNAAWQVVDSPCWLHDNETDMKEEERT